MVVLPHSNTNIGSVLHAHLIYVLRPYCLILENKIVNCQNEAMFNDFILSTYVSNRDSVLYIAILKLFNLVTNTPTAPCACTPRDTDSIDSGQAHLADDETTMMVIVP